jgi:hypothetical protein
MQSGCLTLPHVICTHKTRSKINNPQQTCNLPFACIVFNKWRSTTYSGGNHPPLHLPMILPHLPNRIILVPMWTNLTGATRTTINTNPLFTLNHLRHLQVSQIRTWRQNTIGQGWTCTRKEMDNVVLYEHLLHYFDTDYHETCLMNMSLQELRLLIKQTWFESSS